MSLPKSNLTFVLQCTYISLGHFGFLPCKMWVIESDKSPLTRIEQSEQEASSRVRSLSSFYGRYCSTSLCRFRAD